MVYHGYNYSILNVKVDLTYLKSPRNDDNYVTENTYFQPNFMTEYVSA